MNTKECKIMRAPVVLLFVFSIVACATSPVGADDAKLGTAIWNPWQEPAAGTGELVVTRDKGIMGQACAQKVYVDSHVIGELRTGQKVTVYLPPGQHMAGVQPSGICGGGSAGVSVNVIAGQRQVYRIASGQSGRCEDRAESVLAPTVEECVPRESRDGGTRFSIDDVVGAEAVCEWHGLAVARRSCAADSGI
jgi:hypothetical protein